MTDARNIIPEGPGFIGPLDHPNEYAADVELELVYAPERETVASLILFARDVEAPLARTAVGVELTAGDLREIKGWIDAMLTAAEEDK